MKGYFKVDKILATMMANMCEEHSKCWESNSLEGKYVNYFKVGHNAFEFIFDFGQFYEENQNPRMHTRIITSPLYARAFLKTLQESIEEYDKSFNDLSNDG